MDIRKDADSGDYVAEGAGSAWITCCGMSVRLLPQDSDRLLIEVYPLHEEYEDALESIEVVRP